MFIYTFTCVVTGMLLVVSIFLGFGLAEAPRALWQGSRFVPAIRKKMYIVWSTHRACSLAAEDLVCLCACLRGYINVSALAASE